MPTTYTENLQLTIPAVDDPSSDNQWGTMLNTGVISLMDTAIAGVMTINLTGVTQLILTATQGAADQTRARTYILTGTVTAQTSLPGTGAGGYIQSVPGGYQTYVGCQILFPAGQTRNFTIVNQTTGGGGIQVGVNSGFTTPYILGLSYCLVQGYAAGKLSGARTVDLYSDGTNILPKSYFQSQQYGFDASSPPSTDIALNVGDRVAITYENQTTVPLHCSSYEGLYRIIWVYLSGNSVNSDTHLLPNNQTYSGAFSAFGIENYDDQVTGFGSATSGFPTTPYTVSPYNSILPLCSASTPGFGNAINAFYMDIFGGPTSTDTVNDYSPFIVEYLCSTATAYKVVLGHGGITGGNSSFYMTWNDTTTAWTSLGTLLLNGLGGSTSLDGYVFSGVVYVERVA